MTLEIIPLAFDSLGARSMATFVQTGDVTLTIDPAVALGPKRYRLPPHELEWRELDNRWSKIEKKARESDVLVITHYHYDHHNPKAELEIYRGKNLLTKHPTANINPSQKRRAAFFFSQIKHLFKKKYYSDSKTFRFGKTSIVFSAPLCHGTDSSVGYVTEVLINDGENRFIHTSDIVGCPREDQLSFIVNGKPNVLFMDGPLSYMLGFQLSELELQRSFENIKRIIDSCPLTNLVLDHHFLRDSDWKSRLEEMQEYAAKRKIVLQTAAEFVGEHVNTLEARRRELHREYPDMEPSEPHDLNKGMPGYADGLEM